jgi:hypothetical protein
MKITSFRAAGTTNSPDSLAVYMQFGRIFMAKLVSSQQLATNTLSYTNKRRNIRLIKSNANCRHLKNFSCKGILRQVFFCQRPPPFLCLGGLAGPESGQIQSVKLLQNMVFNRTQHPPGPIPSQPHTVCIYCTLTQGRGVGKGGGWTREKVRVAIVHKAGSKIPPWLTVSPVYKLW